MLRTLLIITLGAVITANAWGQEPKLASRLGVTLPVACWRYQDLIEFRNLEVALAYRERRRIREIPGLFSAMKACNDALARL